MRDDATGPGLIPLLAGMVIGYLAALLFCFALFPALGVDLLTGHLLWIGIAVGFGLAEAIKEWWRDRE